MWQQFFHVERNRTRKKKRRAGGGCDDVINLKMFRFECQNNRCRSLSVVVMVLSIFFYLHGSWQHKETHTPLTHKRLTRLLLLTWEFCSSPEHFQKPLCNDSRSAALRLNNAKRLAKMLLSFFFYSLSYSPFLLKKSWLPLIFFSCLSHPHLSTPLLLLRLPKSSPLLLLLLLFLRSWNSSHARVGWTSVLICDGAT